MTTRNDLALTGGTPVVKPREYRWPIFDDEDVRRVEDVIRSGKWSFLGPREVEFCDAYAEFVGAKYCACLSNGTVTIQAALQAVGVVPGDEVIVPGLTWVATAQAALDIGAEVVLVDIDSDTMGIDPEAVRRAVTPRTRAVVPVHLYGCMADMDAILEIAREHDLKIVEDVAHQHGSRWRDRGAGALGDAGSFSFQQSKTLTAGEGGAVTCNDRDVFETVFAIKHVGWVADLDNRNESGRPALRRGNRYGHNYRMTEMQAALLLGGLKRLPAQMARREECVLRLRENLKRVGGPLQAVPADPRVTRQAYYAMTLRYDPDAAAGLPRGQYLAAVNAEGGRFGAPYMPVYRNNLMNLYDPTSPVPYRDRERIQDYASLRLPNVERVTEETGVLLSQTCLLAEPEAMDEFAEAVRKVNEDLSEVAEHFRRQEKAEANAT